MHFVFFKMSNCDNKEGIFSLTVHTMHIFVMTKSLHGPFTTREHAINLERI